MIWSGQPSVNMQMWAGGGGGGRMVSTGRLHAPARRQLQPLTLPVSNDSAHELRHCCQRCGCNDAVDRRGVHPVLLQAHLPKSNIGPTGHPICTVSLGGTLHPNRGAFIQQLHSTDKSWAGSGEGVHRELLVVGHACAGHRKAVALLVHGVQREQRCPVFMSQTLTARSLQVEQTRAIHRMCTALPECYTGSQRAV